MIFTFLRSAVSMTLSPPGSSRMPTYTLLPSWVIVTLLGRPVSCALATTDKLRASTTSSVLRAPSVMYRRLPSGAAAAPCGMRMSWMIPTTLLVAGSMT
jgi:hypothetical protein